MIILGKKILSDTKIYMGEFKFWVDKNMNKKAQCREPYYDYLKGILITFVIIGHFLPGTLEENFLRYLIYSVHMPIFFVLSGFLFNITRVYEEPAGKTIKKYLQRFLTSWILANNVYYFLNCLVGSKVCTIVQYIKQYIFLYYHLWYVVGFLFCIFSSLVYIKAFRVRKG